MEAAWGWNSLPSRPSVCTAVLRSQVGEMVRETSPVPSPAPRGRGGVAPWRSGDGGGVQHRQRGCVCRTRASPRLSRAKKDGKALRWFWRTKPLVAGKPAFQKGSLACMHWSSTQRPLTSKPHGHQHWGRQNKHSLSPLKGFYALSRVPLPHA